MIFISTTKTGLEEYNLETFTLHTLLCQLQRPRKPTIEGIVHIAPYNFHTCIAGGTVYDLFVAIFLNYHADPIELPAYLLSTKTHERINIPFNIHHTAQIFYLNMSHKRP